MQQPWNLPWNVFFASTIWQLWKARNSLRFENVEVSFNEIVGKSFCLAKDTVLAFTKNPIKDTNNSRNILINWKFPIAGRIKINTDGSFVDYGWASFGGVARDDQGKWLEGFCGRIGPSSLLKADLWGIRNGLQHSKERDWRKDIIETDSQVTLDLIEAGDVDNHPDRIIVQDCRAFEREMEANIVHTFREGN